MPRLPLLPAPRTRHLALLLLPVLLPACAESGDRGGGTEASLPIRSDSAGIEILTFTPPLQGMEEWQVDRAAAQILPGEFHRIAGALERSDGTIVVGDGGSGELRFYDSGLDLAATVGSTGDGPGEFRSIDHILLLPGDSVLVHDAQSRRLSLFDPEGRFSRSFELERGEFSVAPGFQGRMAGGRIIANAPVIMTPDQVRPGRQNHPSRLLLFDPEGVNPRELAAETRSDYWLEMHEGGGLSIYTPPFSRAERIVPGNDLFLIARPEPGELRLFDAEGVLRRILRGVGDAERRVTDEALARETDRLTENARTAESEDVHRAAIRTMDRSATLPAFGEVWVDPEDRIWVREYALPIPPEERGDAVERWSILAAEGTVRTTLALPNGFSPRNLRENRLLGILRDGWGVETPMLLFLEERGR